MENKNKILTELPKNKENNNNWKETVGMDIIILYENIKYNVHINKYDSKTKRLYFSYNDNTFDMYYGHFYECKFGKVFGIYTNKFRFSINTIIKSNKREMLILGQFKRYGNKYYNYKCLKCGYDKGEISEYNIIAGYGCSVCSRNSHTVVKGINDIATTNPWMIKYFKNKEDAYTHSYSSRDRVEMKCPECGTEKSLVIYSLYFDGFSCVCSDGISYPEKFMFSMLKQLGLVFEYQKTFDWSKKIKNINPKLMGDKRYDFYINLDNKKCIIETHGLQHYEENNLYLYRTLQEEQDNDKLKEQLARKNGVINYVQVDCRYSDLEFIKSNILDSELNELFDLSNIDWLACHEFACKSLIKTASDLWANGIRNTLEISKIIKIARTTACRYLKQGAELGWCDYDTKVVIAEASIAFALRNKLRKEVICIETKCVYKSIVEAKNETNINNISAVCRGIRELAGGLHWMFHKKYLEEME